MARTGSIDAGGALRSLSAELGSQVVTLTTNRRQAGADQQWERDALVALRDGYAEQAVHAYTEHGRVSISGTIDEARHRLVEDWWSIHHDHTTAILAVRRADVVALNDLVRARRHAGGELGEELRFGATAFRVGDRMLFEKNQRVAEACSSDRAAWTGRLQVRNGTFGTVVGGIVPADNAPTREGDGPRAQGDAAGPSEMEVQAEEISALIVELDDGRRAVLPRIYVETSTSLGYALTVFRSQGITVDHTFGLGGDSFFQEAGYTQLSRGRLSNNLYVAAPENPRWEIGHHAADIAQRDALQSLVNALGQSREQTMAQDHLPQWPALSLDELAAIYRQHDAVARWLCDQAPEDVTDELAAAYDRAYHVGNDGQDPRSAQADVSVLVTRQRCRDEWVASHRDEIATWSRLDRDVRRYEYRLGQAASYAQPEHVTALLGPLPERVGHAERWQTAAGAIEAYRSRWSIAGSAALGPEPADPEQRAHWDGTVAIVGTAGFLAAGDTREGGSERTSLATRWDNLHTANREPEDDRSMAASPVPSPAFLWPDEPGLDRDLDSGFGL